MDCDKREDAFVAAVPEQGVMAPIFRRLTLKIALKKLFIYYT